MDLQTKEIGNKIVLILSGEVAGLDSIQLSKTFYSYQKSNYDEIIVDLSSVEYLNSNCIGALMYAQVLLKKCNKKIILSAPHNYVKRLFRDCSFDHVFEIVESYESLDTFG